MKTAYVLYWVMKSFIGYNAVISSGAVRVDSLEACNAGATALRTVLNSGNWREKVNEFFYRCEKAQ